MNKTKYATKEQLKRTRVDLGEFPSAGPNPNITGVKQMYWGKDAYCIKHGSYVYNVPREIWDLF